MAECGDSDFAGGTAIGCQKDKGDNSRELTTSNTETTTTTTSPTDASHEGEDVRTADKRKAVDDDSTNDKDKPELKKKFFLSSSLSPEESKSLPKNNEEQKHPKSAPIKMSLNTQKKSENKTPMMKKSAAVAKAFNPDEESEEEEMPPEAKMRMRNIGRDTPTAAGPNSYGKGRLGFCDRQKIFEREIKKKADNN